MSVADVASALRAEAHRTNERRLLALAGARATCYGAAREALRAAGIDPEATTLVGERNVLRCERLAPTRADALLGTTRDAVVLDAHDECRPNAIGRSVGAVDGGGLFVLLAPPLETWAKRRDAFDEWLAVPPYDRKDVAGIFRARLVETLRVHPGIAIVDVDSGTTYRDGRTHPAPRLTPPDDRDSVRDAIDSIEDRAFPDAAYDACVTADQVRCVSAFERLREPTAAVVVEADRGRGKSSAAGLAAGALAADGADVLVTAPEYRGAAEVFARARAVLDALGVPVRADREADPRDLTTATGRVRFASPTSAVDALGDAGTTGPAGAMGPIGTAVEAPSTAGQPADRDGGGPDVVFVDEAAGLPVAVLGKLLDADRVAFTTTIHGYEGAGRGFSVRFRDLIDASTHDVHEVRLDEPIRYAPGDPVEVWAFRALLLDARPPVDQLVVDATPSEVAYEHLLPADLLADEWRLREAFGLLVAAHYRTEPNDLARLLDAPNLSVRALTDEGHVVSVALLALEGGLSTERRRSIYEGERIRGHMIPDVLTSQLRDERAGEPRGVRVVRIATHPAVRSRGLGSHLLEAIRAELEGNRATGEASAGDSDSDTDTDTDTSTGVGVDIDEHTGIDGATGVDAAVDSEPDRGLDPEPDSSGGTDSGSILAVDGIDWLGVGYGATPRLLAFWRENGFSTVHVSTTRNETSGAHSAVMLAPLTERGEALAERHAEWFVRRFPAVLSDALAGLEPDVASAALRSANASVEADLAARDWRIVAGAAYGPGLYDADPRPFRELAVRHLADPDDPAALTAREERLLVARVLQARPPEAIAEALGYASRRQSLRALGDAYATLVDLYGGKPARAERDRYER